MTLTKEMVERISETGVQHIKKYSLPLLVIDQKDRVFQTATGMVIQKGNLFFLTTAAHVIAAFMSKEIDGRLQIGGNGFVLKDISTQDVKLHKKYDFGVIQLPRKLVEFHKWNPLDTNEISKKRPRELDLVAYTGYPGCLTRKISDKEISIPAFEAIGTVNTIEDDQFSILINERNYEHEGSRQEEMTDAGGLSGAPVFSLLDFWNYKKRDPLLIGWLYEGFVWDKFNQKHYSVHSSALFDLI